MSHLQTETLACVLGEAVSKPTINKRGPGAEYSCRRDEYSHSEGLKRRSLAAAAE